MPDELHFEDVCVGDETPPFERTTDLMNWNRYAAVNDEFLYIHMDDDAGRAADQGAAFGMGNLRWAYVVHAIRDWMGDNGELRELSMQFRAINHKGDRLRTACTVTKKEAVDGEHRVHLDITVLNQDSVSTAPGTALVVLPSKES